MPLNARQVGSYPKCEGRDHAATIRPEIMLINSERLTIVDPVGLISKKLFLSASLSGVLLKKLLTKA